MLVACRWLDGTEQGNGSGWVEAVYVLFWSEHFVGHWVVTGEWSLWISSAEETVGKFEFCVKEFHCLWLKVCLKIIFIFKGPRLQVSVEWRWQWMTVKICGMTVCCVTCCLLLCMPYVVWYSPCVSCMLHEAARLIVVHDLPSWGQWMFLHLPYNGEHCLWGAVHVSTTIHLS